MAASVFGSGLYGKLFSAGEAGRLFSDAAEVRAMLLVFGVLAKVQGQLGVIPEISGAAIHRAALELQIDPGGLGTETGQNGVPVPALVAAFRTEMQAPEHAQYVHWGATSQDIMDTGLMLRLRQALALAESRLRTLLGRMADIAQAGADTPCPARTYGQVATPTAWGAVVAAWGAPLLDAVQAVPDVRTGLCVSLSGAAGTSSVLGPHAAATRAQLADALGLSDPGRSWHTDRAPVVAVAQWYGRVMAALAAMGHSLIGLAAHGEVTLGPAGASSTMPQKQNPVGPSALVALHAAHVGLQAALDGAAVHQHQRDGAAWFTEWLVLPQIILGGAAALERAVDVAQGLEPRPDAMAQALGGLGLAHAEALSFALAARMPRPDAQAAVKALCRTAQETSTPLETLARAAYDDVPPDLFAADALGQAPSDARRFAAAVRAAL